MAATSSVTTSEEVREILESFYSMYHPEKLGSIDMILDKYIGNHDNLINQLRDKYSKEFSPIYNVYIQKKTSAGGFDVKSTENESEMTSLTAKVAQPAMLPKVEDAPEPMQNGNDFAIEAKIIELKHSSSSTSASSSSAPSLSSHVMIEELSNSIQQKNGENLQLLEKISLLESQVSKLKSEKFKLASTNLSQAEELEALHNPKKQIGAFCNEHNFSSCMKSLTHKSRSSKQYS